MEVGKRYLKCSAVCVCVRVCVCVCVCVREMGHCQPDHTGSAVIWGRYHVERLTVRRATIRRPTIKSPDGRHSSSDCRLPTSD